jgi:hypothetical protein
VKKLDKGFDDSVIMTKIICNLFMKYECLMIAWDNVLEDQWKLDNLMLQLLKEEQRSKGAKNKIIPSMQSICHQSQCLTFFSWMATQTNNCGMLLTSPTRTSENQWQNVLNTIDTRTMPSVAC